MSKRRRRLSRAAEEYARNQARARRQGRTLDHGTTDAYDRGCRCGPCRGAHLRSVGHPITQGASWVQEALDRLDHGRRPG